jgi:hypothetical protein
MKLEPKQYRDIYKRLPPEIFDLVNSGETTTSLYNIAEKHKLHIDEAGILHDIVMDTAMGVIATKNMQSEIIRELKLNSLDAAAIIRDVDAEVLAPIKESMTNLYKHTNPFMPQTLKHVDEDDEQSSNLDRDSLLHEIENPTESRATKTAYNSNVASSVQSEPISSIAPEKTEDKAAEIADDLLKARRERMLSAITNEKLSGVVAMKNFIEPEVVEATPALKVAAQVSPVVTSPVTTITPAAPAIVPLEMKTPVPISPVKPLIELNKLTEQQAPVTPAVPVAAAPKPAPDPYREAI